MLEDVANADGGELLTPLTFSTDDFAPPEALDGWCGWFGDLNEVIPAEGAPFAARVDWWSVGRFAFARTVSSPVRLVRTADHARRAGLDHWVIRVSRCGTVRSRFGDLAYVSRPGEIVVERLSQAYDDDWSADEWLALIFESGISPDIDRALESLGAGPVTGMGPALLADHLIALSRRLPTMRQAEVPAVAGATRALIATLSRETRVTAGPSGIVARLRAERVIRANLGSARLDGRRIATLSDVSRSSLYRLFEAEGGVAAYVRRLRLDAVRAALADPRQNGRSIADIATEAGFHCIPSFNRSFKARFGAAPGEVRAAGNLLSGEAAPGPDPLGDLLGRGA